MKNKITHHILLYGLLTATNMIVAMDLVITPEHSPTNSPRNSLKNSSKNDQKYDISEYRDLTNSTHFPMFFPIEMDQLSDSSKKELQNHLSANVISSGNRRTFEEIVVVPVTSSIDNTPKAHITESQKNPQFSPVHSPSISPNSSPRKKENESQSSEEISNGIPLQRSASNPSLTILKEDFPGDSNPQEKTPTNLTEQNPQESLQSGWFTNEKPLGNISCYLGKSITEIFIRNPIDPFNYNVTYQNENEQESVIQISSSQSLTKTDTFIIITSPNARTFAIKLPRPKTNDTKDTFTKKTYVPTAKDTFTTPPSNNGKNPPRSIVIGVFTLTAFCMAIASIAYKYNKLDVFINLLNKVLPNRYAL